MVCIVSYNEEIEKKRNLSLGCQFAIFNGLRQLFVYTDDIDEIGDDDINALHRNTDAVLEAHEQKALYVNTKNNNKLKHRNGKEIHITIEKKK